MVTKQIKKEELSEAPFFFQFFQSIALKNSASHRLW